MKTMACLSLVAAVLMGCAGAGVKRDYDASTDFQKLKTYAWRPQTQEEIDAAGNSLVDARVRTAVEEAFAAKGYRKVPRAGADFFAAYHYVVEEGYDSDQVQTGVGVGTGLGRGGFGGISIGVGSGDRAYERETLTIDILDPAAGKLLWRGLLRRRLVHRPDPRRSTEDMRRAVEAILAKFPPQN